MQAVRLDEGDTLVSAILSTGKDELLLVSRRGQALRINEEDVRPMGRSSRGVAGLKLSEGDELCSAIRIHTEPDSKILVVTEKGIGKELIPQNSMRMEEELEVKRYLAMLKTKVKL